MLSHLRPGWPRRVGQGGSSNLPHRHRAPRTIQRRTERRKRGKTAISRLWEHWGARPSPRILAPRVRRAATLRASVFHDSSLPSAGPRPGSPARPALFQRPTRGTPRCAAPAAIPSSSLPELHTLPSGRRKRPDRASSPSGLSQRLRSRSAQSGATPFFRLTTGRQRTS